MKDNVIKFEPPKDLESVSPAEVLELVTSHLSNIEDLTVIFTTKDNSTYVRWSTKLVKDLLHDVYALKKAIEEG